MLVARYKKILSSIAFVLLFYSCSKPSKPKNYIESHPSFFDLKNKKWVENKWIRNPKNLKIVHETFKKVGYEQLEQLITKSDDYFIIHDIYIKRNLDTLIDSLVLTYQETEIPKYYKEFWIRRRSEKNDMIVYEILCDYQDYKKNKKDSLIFDNQYINDTLFHLLQIELGDMNRKKAITDFETLHRFGFHQSAYHLLYERPEYDSVDIDRKALEESLTKTKQFHEAWITDTRP